MKRSKLWVAVIALALCLSMVLVGCNKKKNDSEVTATEEVTMTEEERKDAVVESFNKKKAGPLKLSEFAIRDFVEQLIGTNAFELTIKEDGGESYVVYKNGYMAIWEDGIRGDEDTIPTDYWVYVDGNDMSLFETDGTIRVASSIPGFWMGEDIKIPKGLKFPELKASDLMVEDGKIILSNDYVKTALKQPAIYEVMLGTKTPTSDAKAANDGVIDSVVDAFGIKISFNLSGKDLDSVNISADLNTSGLSDELKAELPVALKGSVDIALNDNAQIGVKVDLEQTDDEECTTVIRADIKLTVDGDVIKSVDCTASVDVGNVFLGTEDVTNEEGNKWYDLYGDESQSFRFTADLSGIKGEKKAKVVDIEIITTPKVKKVKDDGKDVTGAEAQKAINGFYNSSTWTFSAEVVEQGVISYEAEDSWVEAKPALSGRLKFNTDPAFPEVPSEIREYVQNEMKK